MCPLKVRRFGFKLSQAFGKPAGCLPGLPSSSDYFFLLKLKVSPVILSLLCFSKTLLDKLETTLTLHLFGLCLCQMWFCNYLSHDLHSTPEHSFAFQLSRLSARSVAYWCSSYSGRHNCPEAGIESYQYKLFSTHTLARETNTLYCILTNLLCSLSVHFTELCESFLACSNIFPDMWDCAHFQAFSWKLSCVIWMWLRCGALLSVRHVGIHRAGVLPHCSIC